MQGWASFRIPAKTMQGAVNRSDQLRLEFIRDREYSDDDKWVGGDAMKLQSCTQKKVQVLRLEFVKVLFPYFLQGDWLVSLCQSQTIPIKLTGLPIQYLELALSSIDILETIGKAVREFWYDLKSFLPIVFFRSVLLWTLDRAETAQTHTLIAPEVKPSTNQRLVKRNRITRGTDPISSPAIRKP